jgi:hypothetical protein
MLFKPLLFLCLAISFCCNNNVATPVNIQEEAAANLQRKNTYGLVGNIPLPVGFARIKADSNSFAAWLNNLPLKEDKTVYLFNGNKKINQQAQFGVLAVSVGNKDLQQCADAVMRLRAEYLFAQKRYHEIIFRDNEQGIYKFGQPYTKENFMRFMETVFGKCGSASLSKQLKTVDSFYTIKPGDVLIRGGFPGHAVIVLDAAINKAGEKIFMLAQSYMPAQDIHILINPADENLSPWYKVSSSNEIVTPEYLFYRNELKCW